MDLRWIWSGSGVDLGVALEVWPGYAPVWSGYAPVWGLCRDLLEKSHFFVKMIVFFTIFPLGHSNCLQITKHNFSRFLAFYPLISAFHALWRSF